MSLEFREENYSNRLHLTLELLTRCSYFILTISENIKASFDQIYAYFHFDWNTIVYTHLSPSYEYNYLHLRRIYVATR